MPTMWKHVSDGQLSVYWRGRVIFKRWLDRGHGVVIDAYGVPFSVHDGDASHESVATCVVELYE